MRLKKVKNAYEHLLEDKQYFIPNPEVHKGSWNKVFKNDNFINIEIGCGKGRFILNMAKCYPNSNFIAIEKFDSVLIRTLEEIKKYNLSNLKIVLYDALLISNIFNDGEVNNIYLNFSDPWPKLKHAKRRLTDKCFLDNYYKILNKNGRIVQKTDNIGLFEYSLEQYSLNNWYISNISLDLHKTSFFNIMTEYEEKWSKKGPIYKVIASKESVISYSNLNYRIEMIDKFRFAGIEKEFSMINNEQLVSIPKFWEDVFNNKDNMKTLLQDSLGMDTNLHAILGYGKRTTKDNLTYMIGSFVNEEFNLNELTIVDVEKQTYAIFSVSLDKISEAFKNISEIFLKQSIYKHASAAELEVYLCDGEKVSAEIYIPVELK